MGCLGAAKQHYDTALLGRNVFHRGAVRPPRNAIVIQSRAKKVPECIHRLNADRYRTRRVEIPYAHGEVKRVVNQIPKGMQSALTPLGVNGFSAV